MTISPAIPTPAAGNGQKFPQKGKIGDPAKEKFICPAIYQQIWIEPAIYLSRFLYIFSDICLSSCPVSLMQKSLPIIDWKCENFRVPTDKVLWDATTFYN